MSMLCAVMDGLLKTLEQLLIDSKYKGSPDLLIALLEQHPGDRDMTFALQYKLKYLDTSVPGWAEYTSGFVQRYFMEEGRSALRLQVLGLMEKMWDNSATAYHNRLIDAVILKFFATPSKLASVAVTIGTIKLLSKVLAVCDHVHFEAVASAM